MYKFVTSTLGAIFAFAGIAATASAANFSDAAFGISIDVDDALSRQPVVRDIQYFRAKDATGSLLIKRIYDLTIVDFLQELRDVGYRDYRDQIILGMTAEPVDAKIEAGRGLLVPVKGRIRGQQITGVVGAYSGHQGQGFLVIGTAKPQHWASWEPRMKAMFESVRFVEIDHEAIFEEWNNRLKGKKLKHKRAQAAGAAPAGMYYGGAAERDYDLCSDGTVMRKSAAVTQMASPNMTMYGRSTNRSRGTWRVIVSQAEPYLIVLDGPEEEELKLEYEGNTFLLNGKPYVITDSDLCKKTP